MLPGHFDWLRRSSYLGSDTRFFLVGPTKVKVLCISTSFWVLRTPKSWLNYFFISHVQLFLFILNLFQWFTAWNQQKTSENEKKLFFKFGLLLKAGWLAKAGLLFEGVPRNHLFLVDFLLFLTFFVVFDLISLKKVKNKQKQTKIDDLLFSLFNTKKA